MKSIFVCLVHYLKSFEEVSVLLQEHRAYLKKGYENGVLLASGPRIPKDGGVIIGLFHSKTEAEQFSKSDPYVINNLARYEIFEFEPVLHSDVLSGILREE